VKAITALPKGVITMKKFLFQLFICFLLGLGMVQARESPLIPVVEELMSNHSPCDFSSEEEYLAFITREAEYEADLRGIYDENKNGPATVVRIVWNTVRSGNAHAATHDGKGNCNSGCGGSGPRKESP
jgi:hypothetical protein